MKIQQSHIEKAMREMPGYQYRMVDLANRAIEIAQAEAEQSEYISADEARALGAGGAEYLDYRGDWTTKDIDQYQTISLFTGKPIKYRAIKQPKPAEPHAELKALYAQQVAEGTLDNFVWEWASMSNDWYEVVCNLGVFHEFNQYRCTPKPTCQVKLDGELMSREAAIAEATAKKLTHDVWTKYDKRTEFEKTSICFNAYTNQAFEYQLRPKAKKVISWSSLPVGVMTNKGELRFINLANNMACCEHGKKSLHNWVLVEQLTLAPAAEQPWLNWRGGSECPVPEGVMVECTQRDKRRFTMQGTLCVWEYGFGVGPHTGGDIIEYRIVGIELGYVLGGVV